MTEISGKFKSVRVFVAEDAKFDRKLLYKAIAERLLKEGIAGATVIRGIMGMDRPHAFIQSVSWRSWNISPS